MTNEQTQKLLSMYREADSRETMSYFMPVEWNGKKWCAATQGNHFILIPENDKNKLQKPYFKTVDIAKIIPEFNCETEVSIGNLRSAFESIPIVDEEVTGDCDSCDGDGKFIHFGEWYYCKTCNETGEYKTGVFEKVEDPNVVIKIKLATFQNKFIKTLINVIDYTNCLSLKIRCQKEVGLTFFELGNGIFIGISSVYNLNDSQTVVTVPSP